MELSEEAIDYLEQQIPELAELATRQAFWQTLTSGHSTIIAEGAHLVRVYPDGTKIIVGDIEPPVEITQQHFIISPK